eukprot:c16678_g1_i2.p1 GENE.c16678_g1_i2~~c16678_g1_i2.p1  ORF type:complete len:661 (+),score=132.98 c16678_g1_i2:268-1983(+)
MMQAYIPATFFSSSARGREGALLATGDSSDLIYFVYSDRVESQWFTIDASEISSQVGDVKTIPFSGDFPPMKKVAGKLTTDRGLCDTNVPHKRVIERKHMDGKLMPRLDRGKTDSTIQSLMDSWEDTVGSLNVQIGGKQCKNKRMMKVTVVRPRDPTVAYAIPTAEFVGVDASFRITVVPHLFHPHISFMGDNVQDQFWRSTSRPRLSELHPDGLKLALGKSECNVLKFFSDASVFVENGKHWMVEVVDTSLKLSRCLPFAIVAKDESSITLSAESFAHWIPRDEPNLVFLKSNAEGNAYFVLKTAYHTEKYQVTSLTMRKGELIKATSIADTRRELVLKPGKTCSRQFPEDSAATFLHNLETDSKWYVELGPGQRVSELGVDLSVLAQIQDAQPTDGNSDVATSETKLTLAVEYKTARIGEYIENSVSPGMFRGTFKTKLGVDMEVELRMCPSLFSLEFMIVPGFKPFADFESGMRHLTFFENHKAFEYRSSGGLNSFRFTTEALHLKELEKSVETKKLELAYEKCKCTNPGAPSSLQPDSLLRNVLACPCCGSRTDQMLCTLYIQQQSQ